MAPPPDMAAYVACLWTTRAKGGRILPDGCADIVWNGSRLHVAGPATLPVAATVPHGTAVFGVRFRLGAAGAALGLPALELADQAVPLDAVWGGGLEERGAPAGLPAVLPGGGAGRRAAGRVGPPAPPAPP